VLTARDRELVDWVGKLGAVAAADVMAHFGLGRTVAYRRLAACVEAELLTCVRLLLGQPGLYVATRRGLRFAGLDEFWVCRVSASSVAHWQACARLATWLERTQPAFAVRSERELRVAERRFGRPVASALVSSGGRERAHRHHAEGIIVSTGISAGGYGGGGGGGVVKLLALRSPAEPRGSANLAA
jgi:hypothetical protein